MRFDVLAKRYAPLIVCLMLGIAAYFQAYGLGQLVGVLIAPAGTEQRATSGRTSGGKILSALGETRDTSAVSILARNPFDSITGSLTARELPRPPAGETAPGTDRDPYQDPPCEVARVVL